MQLDFWRKKVTLPESLRWHLADFGGEANLLEKFSSLLKHAPEQAELLKETLPELPNLGDRPDRLRIEYQEVQWTFQISSAPFQVDFVAETATDFAFAWKAPGRFTRQPQPQMPQAMGPGLQRELRREVSESASRSSRLRVYTEAEQDDIGISTLLGEYTEQGVNHGYPTYQKVLENSDEVNVFVYFWDSRDGPEFSGWWFGDSVGGQQVWSRSVEKSEAADKAKVPPSRGWRVPWDAECVEGLLIVEVMDAMVQPVTNGPTPTAPTAPPPSKANKPQGPAPVPIITPQLIKPKIQPTDSDQSVMLERIKLASDRVAAAEAEVEQAIASTRRTLAAQELEESSLADADTVLRSQLENVQNEQKQLAKELSEARAANCSQSNLGELARMMPRLRQSLVKVEAELAKVKNNLAKVRADAVLAKQRVEAVEAAAEAEQRDARAFQAALPEAMEIVTQAEDAVETVAILAAAMSVDDETDTSEAHQVQAIQDIETSATKASADLLEARKLVSNRLGETKRFAPEAKRVAMQEFQAMEKRLAEAAKRLNPLKRFRQEFEQKAAAKKALQEIQNKLNSAELEIEKAHIMTSSTDTQMEQDDITSTTQLLGPAEEDLKKTSQLIDQRQPGQSDAASQKELEGMKKRVVEAREKLQSIRQVLKRQEETLQVDSTLSQVHEKIEQAEEAFLATSEAEMPFLKGLEVLPLDEGAQAVAQCEAATKKCEAALESARTFIKKVESDSKAKYSKEAQQHLMDELQKCRSRGEETEKKLNVFRKETRQRKAKGMLQEVSEKVVEAENQSQALAEVVKVLNTENLDSVTVESLKTAFEQSVAAEKEAVRSYNQARQIITAKQKEVKEPPVLTELTRLQKKLAAAHQEMIKSRQLAKGGDQLIKGKKIFNEEEKKVVAMEQAVERVEKQMPAEDQEYSKEDLINIDSQIKAAVTAVNTSTRTLEAAMTGASVALKTSLTSLMTKVKDASSRVEKAKQASKTQREKAAAEEGDAENVMVHPVRSTDSTSSQRMEEILSQLNALAARVEMLERRAEGEPVSMLGGMKEVETIKGMDLNIQPISSMAPMKTQGSTEFETDTSVASDITSQRSPQRRTLTQDLSRAGTSLSEVGRGRSSQLLYESFWDATVVLGMGDLGMATTFLVTIGIMVSVCAQSLFCWVVFAAFLSPDAKYDPAFLTDWRLLVGHGVKGYDANSGSSLISRACRGKPFDREWWADALLNEIDDYLTPLLSDMMTVGFVLSSMAVAIWLAYIAKELQRVGCLMANVARIPRGASFISNEASGGRNSSFHRSASASSLDTLSSGNTRLVRTFRTITLRRTSVLLFVFTIRATLAVLLGFCGALWLCRTRDIENIIQNGVSLVFVLEIDELFFELFAPRHASRFITSIARVETQARKPWVENAFSVLQFAAFFVVVALFVIEEVYENNLSAQRDWMWRTTMEGRGEVAVKHTPTVNDFNAWLSMDQFQVADHSTYGFGNWFGNTCFDQGRDFWEGDWLWSTAMALTGATDCPSAEAFCGRKEFPLVRMLCPQTCRCTSADSGQFLSNGCRLGCRDEASFMNSSCHDIRVNEPERKEAWDYYWSLFYSNNKGHWQEDHELMVFAKNGSMGDCEIITREAWMINEFCFHFHNAWVARRPLTAFCPETCGCLQEERPVFVKEAEQQVENVEAALVKVAEAELPFLKGIEVLPLSEASIAIAECEKAAKHVQEALEKAKSFVSAKVMEVQRFAEAAAKPCLERLNGLVERNNAAATKLTEFRKDTESHKRTSQMQEAEEMLNAAEAEIEKTREAGAPLSAEDLSSITQEIGTEICEKIAALEKGASKKVSDALNFLAERRKDVRGTPQEKELEQFQARLGKIKASLAEAKKTASQQEQRFVSRKLQAEGLELVNEVEREVKKVEVAAEPLLASSSFLVRGNLHRLSGLVQDHISKGSSKDSVFQQACGERERVTLEGFQAFVTWILEQSGEDSRDVFLEQEVEAMFTHLDSDKSGDLTEKKFQDIFLDQFACVQPVSMTESFSISEGKSVLKLDLGVAVEALSRPQYDEQQKLTRLHCRLLEDSTKEGWVTMKGNQGKVFLDRLSPHSAHQKSLDRMMSASTKVVNKASSFLSARRKELNDCSNGPLLEAKVKMEEFKVKASSLQRKLDEIKKKVAEAAKEYEKCEAQQKRARSDARDKRLLDAMTKAIEQELHTLKAEEKRIAEVVAPLTNGADLEVLDAPVSILKDGKEMAEKLKEQSAAARKSIQQHEVPQGVAAGTATSMRQVISTSLSEVDTVIKTVNALVKAVNSSAVKVAEAIQRRVQLALRQEVQRRDIRIEVIFDEISNGGHTASRSDLSRCLNNLPDLKLTTEQISLMLDRIIGDNSEDGVISRWNFLRRFQQFYECQKTIALTHDLAITNSKPIRMLNAEEAIEVLEGPRGDEKSGIERIRGRAVRDNTIGWVSVSGNQGSVFLKERPKPFVHCLVDLPLEKSFRSSGEAPVRSLKTNEVLEILEGPRQDSRDAVMRVRCKVFTDQLEGWVTLNSAGEMQAQTGQQRFWKCKTGVAVTDGPNIKLCKVLRKMEVGELIRLLEGPEVDKESGVTRIKALCLKDGLEGWVTTLGNAGTLYAEEKSDIYSVSCDELPLQKAYGDLSSGTIRMLRKDEAFEVLEGPKEFRPEPVERMKGRALADGAVGWVTATTKRLKRWYPNYICKQNTVLQTTVSIGPTAGLVRRVEEGELLEVLDGPKEDSEAGVLRVKVKTRKDQAVGWITLKGNQGTLFLIQWSRRDEEQLKQKQKSLQEGLGAAKEKE
ncbi:unnamed protein product [Durusdinium trenchii]